MGEELAAAIARLRDDKTSGASELVLAALGILKRARLDGPEAVGLAARAVREAQPSMASLYNLAAAAVRERDDPGSLERFERRWRMAGPALARAAAEVLQPVGGRPPRLVTCSFSGSVLACVKSLLDGTSVSIACGEGRPAFEGRRMAAALAAAGAEVQLFTDAALAGALQGVDALILGADAVTPGWFLNKCGTAALAGAAARAGIPAYVVATLDKFLSARDSLALRVEQHDPREVWESPPESVKVRNPYFERVPIDLLAGVITERGVLAPGTVGDACQS